LRVLKSKRYRKTIYVGAIIKIGFVGPGVYSASNRNEYQKHKNNVSGE
jgi:hypothetical protein